MLKLFERFLRLGEIQVVQHAEVQIRRRVIGFNGYRTLIRRFRFRKFTELAFRDAELVIGDGTIAGLRSSAALKAASASA